MNECEVKTRIIKQYIAPIKKEHPEITEKQLQVLTIMLTRGLTECSVCGWRLACTKDMISNMTFLVMENLTEESIDKVSAVMLPVIPDLFDAMGVDDQLIADVYVKQMLKCKKLEEEGVSWK